MYINTDAMPRLYNEALCTVEGGRFNGCSSAGRAFGEAHRLRELSREVELAPRQHELSS